MNEMEEQRRVYWHSRRGMLELDLLLMPFASNVYATLDAGQQALYRRFLEYEDTELFAWLVHDAAAPDAAIASMIERIKANGRIESAVQD
jgi:antitoxin CptB